MLIKQYVLWWHFRSAVWARQNKAHKKAACLLKWRGVGAGVGAEGGRGSYKGRHIEESVTSIIGGEISAWYQQSPAGCTSMTELYFIVVTHL